MKRKEKANLREKTLAELTGLLGEAAKELVKLRMETRLKKLKDTNSLRKKRAEIAIIKTIMKEKKI